MRELKRDKEWFYDALRIMLGFYDNYRNVLKLSKEEAIERTLDSYDDFYEMLQKTQEEE